MKTINLFNRSNLCFKHWNGENYAVFNSLKKVMKIGALAATYLSVFGFHQTFAQTDTASINKKINLEEVEVSARRTTSVYSEVGRVLHVIPRKEIEALPVYSVQDLLRYAMNVDVRQRGPLGIQADVSIRGGSFDQVMILFNGINVTDPQTGHLSLNLPVDMQSIERVEILEGPGARVYGPGAFSGAINFVTGTKTKNNITANVLTGQHGLYNASVNATVKTGKLKNYVAASTASSDGYIDNTDFKNHSIFYQGQLNFGQEKLDVQIGHNDKAFGANAFYTPKYPNQFEQNKTTFASIKLTAGDKLKITPAMYWRRHQDRFELFRNNPASWYTSHNYHLTDVFGGSFNAVIPWEAGKTSVGGEVRSENVWSNVLGYEMDEPKDVPGEDAQFTKSYQRTNVSTFIEHVYTYQRFSISGGLLINYNTGLDFKADFFPGLDVSYWVSNEVKVFGSANKTLRMPTFTDLFYDGPSNIGNPNLKPEEAITYEAGIKTVNNWLNGQASVYYRQGENLIDWGRLPGDVEYSTRNLSDVNSLGFQVQGRINIFELIGRNPFNTLEVGYAHIDQDKTMPDNYESAYVEDYLKHKLNIGLHARLIDRLGLSVNALYQDREGEYIAFTDGTYDEIPTSYQPFWLTDVRLQWSADTYKIFIDANNVFDEQYYDLGNVVQPGRWIKAGVRVSLNL
ncbi:TonB-dependent receptor [Carboxylicivirga sp. A043]|uniref:TonB-dependent receptor n=1 Tax=Carboxylicivirga litoralis TaxID=2816963 RepID=UPI0021CB97D9|nr:TonB-dependent receptor [Carboxylicivirga sp. A043]MCU4157685.1 TonB-dependent receptor [Carboxylicivirga sp. A043]